MTLESIRSNLPAVQSSTLPVHLAELRAWAETYTEVARFVAPLVDTPFVPAAFRPEAFLKGRPDEGALAAAREIAVASATAAVLFGAAIGFDPLTALQNVYVVGGRPGLYAAAMVAIVQGAGHEVWTEDITDSRAIVCGRRKGGAEERVVVTMDQAKKAGWTRNAKYGSEPQAMLWARAASTVCRRIAQDALKGIARSVEELDDEVAVEVRSAARTVKAVAAPVGPRPVEDAPAVSAQTRQERPTQDVHLPPLPGEDAPEEVRQAAKDAFTDRAPELSTEKQWRDINATFVTLGETGPGQSARRLEQITLIVGRRIQKGSELTAVEAALVLDTLQGMTPAGAETLAGDVGELEQGETTTSQPAPAVEAEQPHEQEVDEIDPTTDEGWGEQT